MPDKHALLSPSSAARWLNCPRSARLTEGMDDESSIYAEEGRIAHSLGELKLRKYFFSGLGPKKFTNAKAKLKEELTALMPENAEDSFKEMDNCTDDYVNAVSAMALEFESAPYVALEQEINFDEYAPDGFGTADCLLIGGGVLHVIDYKHGKGVAVDARDNPQLKLYALGAYQRYGCIYPIERMRMSIIQPRNGGVSEPFELSLQELLTWGETVVKPNARLAFDGGGDFKAGEWCRFCKVKQTCRARSAQYLSLAEKDFIKPELLSHDEVGEVLKKGKDLASWLSDVEEYALAKLLSGESIAGWKAVEGRSIRSFTDQAAAFAHAAALGVDEAMLWERKPISLAGLEKIMGKTAFQQGMLDFVTIPRGKPTLVPENDKRPAIANTASVEDDFSK